MTCPRVHRFYRLNHCYSLMDNGRVIGHGISPKCALMIKAGAGDLVAITERISGDLKLRWRYYRVGLNLEILPFDPGNRKLSRDEINRHLKNEPGNPDPLLIAKDDIAEMFITPQPTWLQLILDAQLLHWHRHEPPIYYKHTRKAPTGSELQRCVDQAPFQALARWKHQLSSSQLAQAIRTNPEGAVRFALGEIPIPLREDYLQRNASFALQSAEALSEPELALCSKADAATALLIRSNSSPKRSAITLANSYFVFWNKKTDDELTSFHREVMESIRSFPTEWLAAHDGRFERLVKELHLYLSLDLDVATLAGLLDTADATQSAAVAEYIASRV